MDLLRSKKFQMALIALIVVIAKHFIPELDEASAYEVLAPFIAYIIGQGIADFGKERALIMAAYDLERRDRAVSAARGD